ncbi:MAG TPA: type II toxin-antitoxin system YafQ family toxin [Rhabdochlamydiaceae bacterium]|nr:type II toxin-antitoxin system YafQ family toxin [Rhabdochlamydiaceae bacterium]
MFNPTRTTQFKRDVKQASKRGKNIKTIMAIMTKLAKGETLEPKHRDHKLSGDYVNHRECHIEPDWLLIYKIEKDIIVFVRTGTHSDLFKK